MNEPIKPKLKPHHHPSAPEQVAQVVKPIVEETMTEIARGETPTLDHMASLHGLGLLVEIAKIGAEHIGTPRQSTAGSGAPHPNDPRRCIDPRTRNKPR